ncbi:MAG: glycosyltransferase [Bacilli bacterium]|nr:glycosyltransferase [Bacilli bacterium]
MKVLIINSVCGIGSTGRICADLAQVLAQQGHKVCIAYGRGVASAHVQSDTYKIESKFANYKNALFARLFDNEGFNAVHSTKKLINFIEKYNPDIIHLHNLHGYYLNVAILFEFLKTCHKPVVWTLHDMWPFSGHSAVCDFSSCEKWRTGCSKCPCLREYPRAVCDFSKRNFYKKKNTFCGLNNMTIVTPSNWLALLVKESFLNSYPVQVINNGIDLTKFYPTENFFRETHSLGNKTIILGVASPWNDRKGYKDFLQLAGLVNPMKSTIVMVGLNPKQIGSLPKNVIGIGRTDNVEQLADIYSSADVFLNLTYADNFPTTNLESIACGTPVLTYKTGGSAESIDLKCGWVVEKGDVESTRKMVDGFVKQDTDVLHCVEKSKEYDKWDKYSEYINLYRRLLANN